MKTIKFFIQLIIVGALALLATACSPEEQQQRCGKVEHYGIDACGEYYVKLWNQLPTVITAEEYNAVEPHEYTCVNVISTAYPYNCPN